MTENRIDNVHKKNPDNRILLMVGVIFYSALLRWVYTGIIAPAFDYNGFFLNSAIPLEFNLLGWLWAILPGFWLPIAYRKPSHVICWVLYLLVIAPFSFIPFHISKLGLWQVVQFQLIVEAAFWLLCLVYRLPKLHLPRLRIHSAWYWCIILAFTLMFYGLMTTVFGFNLRDLFNVNFAQTYSTRREYKVVNSNLPSFYPYLVEWQGNVINPLLITTGLVTANPFSVALGMLGELYIFAIAGYKSMLFTALVLVGLWAALMFKGRYFGYFALGGMSLLVAGSILYYNITGDIFVPSVFVRRLIFVPAQLTSLYFEFFSQNPRTSLSYGVLHGLVSNPYGEYVPAAIINNYAFGTEGGNANANIWGDAYANFGMPGIVIFTLLAFLMLWVFDSVTSHLDYRLTALMAGVPSFTLANTALLTGMLSHGIGLTILLLYLMPTLRITNKWPRFRLKRPRPQSLEKQRLPKND